MRRWTADKVLERGKERGVDVNKQPWLERGRKGGGVVQQTRCGK